MTTLATVLIDPPTTLFAGCILGLISMKLVKTKGLDEVWRVGQLSAAWGFVYALSVGWHFFFRTDWMLCYLLDGQKVPLVPYYALFLFACTGWGALGGLATAILVHLGKTGLAWVATASAVLGFGMLLYMSVDQYKVVGTLAEYLAGKAKPMTEDAAWVTASNISPVVFGIAAVGIIVLQVRRMRTP